MKTQRSKWASKICNQKKPYVVPICNNQDCGQFPLTWANKGQDSKTRFLGFLLIRLHPCREAID
jgi:hypothetical protein